MVEKERKSLKFESFGTKVRTGVLELGKEVSEGFMRVFPVKEWDNDA